jgi:hypothetical protein
VSASAAPAVEVTQQGEAPQSAGPSQPAVVDDPEIELDTGVKLKRSELRDLHTRRKELDRGSHERFQQAAKKEKESEARLSQANEIISGLSKDAKAALRAAGINPVQFAEQVLAEALAEHQLSPAEKEARALKEENERYKKADDDRAKQEQATKEQAAVSQWEQRFDQAFAGAIQTVGLPKTARVVSRMAEKVESYWGAGINVPLEEIAAEIKQDLIAERRELLQSMKDEQIGDLYDKDELEKARKLLLRQAQPQQPQTKVQASKPAAKSKHGLTRAELDARISKRLGA